MASLDFPPEQENPEPIPGEQPPSTYQDQGVFGRIAHRFTTLAERFVPDAYVFAILATLVVCLAAIALRTRDLGVSRATTLVVDAWGHGFWDLLAFTMQMALVIITGYVLATARPIYRLIARLASWPKHPKTAVTFVAVFSMTTSWLNWGFSLIFGAMLAKEIARQNPRADYRALCASSFLGLGSIWAQGLSGSAALQMASPRALPGAIRAIVGNNGLVPDGIVPLRSTIFLWQSFVAVAIEILAVTCVVYVMAPAYGKNANDLGIPLGPSPLVAEVRSTDTGLEHQRWPTWVIAALGVTYLVRLWLQATTKLDIVSLDTVNLTFLVLGMVLHGTPARLVTSLKQATPAVSGVILQFPFYAAIAAVMVKSGLSEELGRLFVSASTRTTFPALVAIYSACLGIFVPSGGSKWVIEAPYVMSAAHTHQVHLGWMVTVYDLGEALANLIQPFWMLPMLGIFGLRARDVMGYTFLVFLVLTPIVLLLVTLLAPTLHYPL